MHPDYLDYVVEKRKVLPRATWTDIKFMCRKVLGVQLNRCYVQHVSDGHWRGWVVEFRDDVDLAELKRQVFGVLLLGERVVFIGVVHG